MQYRSSQHVEELQIVTVTIAAGYRHTPKTMSCQPPLQKQHISNWISSHWSKCLQVRKLIVYSVFPASDNFNWKKAPWFQNLGRSGACNSSLHCGSRVHIQPLEQHLNPLWQVICPWQKIKNLITKTSASILFTTFENTEMGGHFRSMGTKTKL